LPPGDENVFKGEFIVTKGDFIPASDDGSAYAQAEKSRFYQLKLDQIFGASHMANKYLFNEVLLLEGLGPQGVKVHFNIHMSPQDVNVTSEEIITILKEQIETTDVSESYLAEIEVDSNSLIIEGKIGMTSKKVIKSSKM
jgi:hypothetical protein